MVKRVQLWCIAIWSIHDTKQISLFSPQPEVLIYGNDKKHLLCPQYPSSGFWWMILIKAKKYLDDAVKIFEIYWKPLHLTDWSWEAPKLASYWIQKEKQELAGMNS